MRYETMTFNAEDHAADLGRAAEDERLVPIVDDDAGIIGYGLGPNAETIARSLNRSDDGERERAASSYAAKFYAETYGAEPRRPVAPNDANLAAVLRNCALRPPPSLYDAIRKALLDEYGIGR